MLTKNSWSRIKVYIEIDDEIYMKHLDNQHIYVTNSVTYRIAKGKADTIA